MLVRAAVQDDPVQSPAAERVLRDAATLIVTTVALCEFVWVLTRSYRRPATDVARSLRWLVAAENVVVDRLAVAAGLFNLDRGGDFADGVIAHEGRRAGAEIFLSFDARARATAPSHGLSSAAP